MQRIIHIECKVKELMPVLRELAQKFEELGITTLGEYKEYLGRLN